MVIEVPTLQRAAAQDERNELQSKGLTAASKLLLVGADDELVFALEHICRLQDLLLGMHSDLVVRHDRSESVASCCFCHDFLKLVMMISAEISASPRL